MMRQHRYVLHALLTAWLWPGAMAYAAPLGQPGTFAQYQLEGDLEERPAFEREHALSVVAATIQLGPVVLKPERGLFQWYGLTWTRCNGDQYAMWILLDGWPTAEETPETLRYLWQEPGWPDPLQYVHAATGAPVLPRVGLWTYGWPQCPTEGGQDRRAPVADMSERILLHGWPFLRISTGMDSTLGPPAQWSTIRLNPDLLIGWIPIHRDVDGRPFYRLPDGQYRYGQKTEQDILEHARSGSNFFVSHPDGHGPPEWLTRSSLFHSYLYKDFRDWPADLYRSNYWGRANHIDEPGVANWGLPYYDEPDRPGPLMQAVVSLQRIVRQQAAERGDINTYGIDRKFGRGDLQIEERDFPTWEYEWATAWYQLAVEDGIGGIVDEDATSNDLVESYNMAFGTQIPPTVENACAIRVAVLRGAARNFSKRWGVAFYNPNEVKLKSATIPYFYQKGATYFWFWTGWEGIGDNSGLPDPYQRYYASLTRQAFEKNPHRDMAALLRAARVAVVIPYGYTFTPHHMHRLVWLNLEQPNADGVAYRQVLANVATEVERLLRLGIEFDLAVDDPLFNSRGYDELVYVQSDGQVRIVRPDKADIWQDGPRPVERPHLGPEPRMDIVVVREDASTTGKVVLTLKAEAQIAVGEWAGEREWPLISWEIYSPDGRVSPEVFPEYGVEQTLELDNATSYTVVQKNQAPLGPENSFRAGRDQGAYMARAATADVFGRPAVAYIVIQAHGGYVAE